LVKNVLSRFGAASIISFSLPLFYDNFEEGKGISNSELSETHQAALSKFLAEI
jgi:hypothetical protein